MTQEEKQLILTDLCAKLPYEVMVDFFGETKELLGIFNDIVSVGYDINDYEEAPIEDIKPYLRPMSSMTEEEQNKFIQILSNVSKEVANDTLLSTYKVFDYCNSIHVDYRGLITKGLALEAPKGMYV